MDNWLSYIPDKYYTNDIYSTFGIDEKLLEHDSTNNKEFYTNVISTLTKEIDLHDKCLYDCGCNVGTYCITLAQYVKVCYGIDVNNKFIRIAQFIKDKYNISNCHFFNKTFFDFNNKQWYYNNISNIDILLLMSFGCALFQQNTSTELFNMIQLIQHYRPKYVILHNLYYYSKYIGTTQLSKFIKFMNSKSYKKKKELSNTINPLWIFTNQIE